MAKLGHKAKVLIGFIDSEDVAEKLVTVGTPQNISSLLSGMAKLGHKAKILASFLDRQVVAEKLARKAGALRKKW